MKRSFFIKRISAYFLLLFSILLISVSFVFAEGTTEEDEQQQEQEAKEAEELKKIVSGIHSTKNISKYGMTPISGTYVKDGIYPIDAKSNSVYFRMEDAQLTVQNGVMTARFTIPSMSYLNVYMGTKKEAADSAEADRIGFEEENGCTVFTVPVEALNEEFDCAAYSKNRKKWYDRKIIFYADSLPEDALLCELPDYGLIEKTIMFYESSEDAASFEYEDTRVYEEPDEDPDVLILYDDQGNPLPVDMDVEDGDYSIEVNMTGGSGRASISSPTWLTVRDGGAYATLLWSSTYYDYLILGGKTYYNQTTDGGNSTFEIPIPIMNEAFPIIADTTAMGEPVEIRYMLTFYDDTVGDRGRIPQVAAGRVLIIAAAILGAGGLLNIIVKKRRKA